MVVRHEADWTKKPEGEGDRLPPKRLKKKGRPKTTLSKKPRENKGLPTSKESDGRSGWGIRKGRERGVGLPEGRERLLDKHPTS